MMNLDNKCLLIDDECYEIIDYVNYNDKYYVYLVNINDELDSAFKEIQFEDNSYKVLDIDKSLFQSTLLQLFIDKFEKY